MGAGCLAGQPLEDKRAACETGLSAAPLYAASGTPSTVLLPEAQRLAIVLVEPAVEGAMGVCTGALLADEWVITAAHCAREAATVAFGEDPVAPRLRVRPDGVWQHPERDVGLMRISQLELRGLGAVPIPMWKQAVPGAWAGEQLELVGRGLTEAGSFGEIRFVSEMVTAIDESFIEVDGMGESGACLGDSGGPLLVQAQDGTPRIAGILSRGSASCRGRDLYVRADRFGDWVRQTMQAHSTTQLSCP